MPDASAPMHDEADAPMHDEAGAAPPAAPPAPGTVSPYSSTNTIGARIDGAIKRMSAAVNPEDGSDPVDEFGAALLETSAAVIEMFLRAANALERIANSLEAMEARAARQ